MAERVTEVPFPMDAVMEILLRSPIKSIVRFRCVSQLWNSSITSHDFIKNYLANAKPSLLLRTDNPIPSYSLHLDNDHFDRCSRLEFPIQNQAGLFDIVGSCNGVICLSRRYLELNGSRRLILWNPSIRKTLHLPPPTLWPGIDTVLLGHGYDTRSDDYKVARIVRLNNPAELPFVFQFYSLNLGYWNENVDVSSTLGDEDALRNITIYRFHNVIVNGAIHWLLNRRDNDNNGMLALSFNLSNNSFWEILLPAECFSPTRRIIAMSISVFKDSLSFNVFENWCGGNFICEIWVMNQHGVRESWARQYQIEILHIARQLVFRSNEEILMTGYANIQLVSCDAHTQIVRDVGLDDCDYADYFVESLALLDR